MNRLRVKLIAFIAVLALLVPAYMPAGAFAAANVQTAQTLASSEAVKVERPLISLKVKGDSITVTVGKTENAKSYKVFCKVYGGAKYTLAGKIGKDGRAKRTFVIKGLEAGRYQVRVRAFNGKTSSKFSKVKTAVVSAADGTHSEILSYWNDDAPAKKAIVSYMKAITKEGGKDYIPAERRIAVFDLDGTIVCETDPNYFDHMLLAYRVLEDPDYKDKASDFEKKVAKEIIVMNETGYADDDMEVNHGIAVASSFKGFTPDEFYDYIAEYKKTPMRSYRGMTLGEAFYKPMLQIVEYLKANDFTVYIVSGTDRFIVRGLIKDSALDIPFNQIIGSDETLVSDHQNGKDGLEYVFTDKDKVVFGGEFIVKNLKMNKVTVIAQEIGLQPVLSFGNSTGDSSMAEYVTTKNPYRSLAFMLCCDDIARENGNIEKADKMKSLCETYDWIPVSMRNDWTTIYGDEVMKITN